MTHTAQKLYRFATKIPSVARNLERTFQVLDKWEVVDTDKATALLLKNNVRDAARLYVQVHGLPIAWWRAFPLDERERCAALFLRLYTRLESANAKV